MAGQVSKPIEKYIEAFSQFAEVERDEFLIKTDSEVLVCFKGLTYKICHFDDLLWEFKTYFNKDLTLIYTEIPMMLWERLFEEHGEITEEDLIIDIYNSWKFYWERETAEYTDKNILTESKEQSWKEFELLVERIKTGPGNIIENASEISDITLIPILAIAIRMQFKNEEDFYKECVEMLIEEFPDTFSEKEHFDEVNLDPENPGIERYYIYQPDYDFNK